MGREGEPPPPRPTAIFYFLFFTNLHTKKNERI